MNIEYHNQQYASVGYPPVFVINLRRSPERRQSIRCELERAKVPYALVEAVDGKRMTPDTLVAYNYLKDQRGALPARNRAYLKSFMLPGSAKHFRMPLSIYERDFLMGEIGVVLSHCKIYAHIFQNKIPLSVILEDDAFLSPDFGEVLLGLNHCYHEYGVIFLGTIHVGSKSFIEKNCPVSLWGRKKVTSATKLGHFIDIPYGAHGYAVSWQGASGLLSLAIPLTIALDNILCLGLYDNRYKIAGVKPEIAVQDLSKNSTIDEQRMDALAKASQKQQQEKHKNRFRLLYRFRRAVKHFRKRLKMTGYQVFPTWPT